VLQRHQRAVVLAVGPDGGAEWDEAARQTGGRIKAVGPRQDVRPFFQAADVYVDSFPIPSTTSMLEAGSYGVPLVSRCLSAGDAGVLGADSPGLNETMFLLHDLEGFRSVVDQLIVDEARRAAVGEQTRQTIGRLHTGDTWQESLEAVYRQAGSIPHVADSTAVDRPEVAEVDLGWSFQFRSEQGLDVALRHVAWGLPLDLRLRWCLEMARLGQPVHPALLLPRGVVIRARDSLARLRRPRRV
jgi:hypothetical protein